MSEPATGEQIVAYFRTWNHDAMWTDNWAQGISATDPRVPGTTTTIQGVLCCVDRDNTIAWLVMVCDSVEGSTEWTVSYICAEFGSWLWAWIRADDNLHACREFVNWLACNDETPAQP